jgi:hypothetical protein
MTHQPSSLLTDDHVGSLLHDAVSSRVDRVMENTVAPARPVAARPRRRRLIVPVVAALSVVGVTGGVVHQLALRPTPSPVDVVVQADAAAAEPRLVLRAPGFTAESYLPAVMMTPAIDRPDTIYLRNGSRSFYVSISTPGSSFVFPEGSTKRSVAVGSAPGTLVQFNRGWSLDWTVDGVLLRGSGRRPPTDADLDVMGAVRTTSERNLSTAGPFPHGFSATLVERQEGGYLIGYRRDASDSGPDYSLSVRPSPPFVEDFFEDQKIVERGGRRYAIESYDGKMAGPLLGAAVTFEVGPFVVSVFGPSTADSVLGIAEQVREATLEEWAEVQSLRMDSSGPSRPPALVDGDVDGTPFSLTSPRAASGVCPKVIFRAEGTVLDECLPASGASEFRLLSSTVVKGRTVVFGVSPSAGDNQVIRIVDAAGDVVAEDVTVDQDLIDGRAFAVDIPADAVAPFTAELYDFDRSWYVEADPEPDSFVRPGADRLESKTVPDPAPRITVG